MVKGERSKCFILINQVTKNSSNKNKRTGGNRYDEKY